MNNDNEVLECWERIDNTLCLNNDKGNLEFGIDDEEHIDCDNVIDMIEDLETIKQALLELKSIKEANTSEALECLERIGAEKLARGELIRNDNKLEPYIATIKQALLKVQEPNHYLKWEDLDFTEDTKCQKATMNGKEYTLYYFVLNDTHNEVLIQNNEGSICSACNEQFFNDLHLERVE